MKVPLRQSILTLAAVAVASAQVAAQTAPASPNPDDPSKKEPPAEIMPKPELRPPAGQKEVEPPAPAHLSPASKGATGSPQPSALQAVIDALPEEELDKILSTLRQRFAGADTLSDLQIKRATVQGIVERLGSGATLLGAAPTPAEPSPFRSEVVQERTGYVRLGALSKETLAQVDEALRGFKEKNLTSVVLDLRATPAGTDFELSAELCRRFCPKGQVLFTVQRPAPAPPQIQTAKTDPLFTGLLLVLVDADTAGSAEVVAGTLRSLAKAIVIGQRTRGEAAEFSELPLASGATLRFAVAEAKPAGGESILTGGVVPDIPVEMSAEMISAVLKQELEGGVAPLLVETERPRMNEAALVAGTNPEIDAMMAAQRLRGVRSKPQLHDAMLLRAMDLVTSLSVLKKP